jgi:hypothetical protein
MNSIKKGNFFWAKVETTLPTSQRRLTFLSVNINKGRAIPQAVSRRIPATVAGVRARVKHVQFVVEKVSLDQFFSKYLGFPFQFLFRQLFYNHHPLSSGVGTLGQYWSQYQADSILPH